MSQDVAIPPDLVERWLGRPYAPAGDGPDAFDCYGLVRHFDRVYGPDRLPDITRPADEALSKDAISGVLRGAPVRGHWRKVTGLARHWDVVVMGNIDGREFHLGRCLMQRGQFGVLHVEPRLGVVFDDLPTLRLKGFNRVDHFRPVERDESEDRARASRT